MNKSEMAKQEKEWRADADLRTLIEAEKIKKDKARLAAAMAVKKKMMTDLEKIGGEK